MWVLAGRLYGCRRAGRVGVGGPAVWVLAGRLYGCLRAGCMGVCGPGVRVFAATAWVFMVRLARAAHADGAACRVALGVMCGACAWCVCVCVRGVFVVV